MKEDLTNIEVEIKDVADGMSFEIDTADLWANIEPQLPPVDNGRKRPVWWMMTGLLFVLVLAGSLFTYNLTATDDINYIPNSTNIAPENLLKNEASIIESKGSKNKTLNNSSSLKQNEKYTSTTSSGTQTHQLQANYDDEHGRGRLDNSGTEVSINEASDIAIIHQFNNEPTIDETKNIILSEASRILNTPTNSNSNTIKKLSETVETRSSLAGIASIKILKLALLNSDQKKSIPNPIIEPLKANNWHPFLQFGTGLNKSNNTISIVDNEVTIEQQFAREQNLFGLSSSILYGQENNNGWRIFGGLSHLRTTTRYSNFEETITQNTTTGVESKTIDEFGNEFETLGEITVTEITKNDIIWHQSHDYVNLELGIGKRYLLVDQLSLITDIYGGYNLWSRHDGYYFEKDKPTITKFTSSDINPYQNKGADVGARLGLDYDLGDFSIGLAGYYNHGLGNTTKSNNYYQIKNSHYGIQLGVVYRP